MSTPFTPAQLDAVNVDLRHQDACVVAGPGSGKTTVLVEYFRRLVEAGVDPLRILAITFTEKAAANMRHKLGRAFQEQTETRARLERAWVSTVHGFCLRLLKENAVFAGLDPEFRIADERQSWRLQRESLKSAIDELLTERLEPMRALIRALSVYEFERYLLNAYDTMRGAGVGVEALAHYPVPAGVTVEDVETSLDAIRNEPPMAWSYAQKQELERALEGAERIVSVDTPLAALQAVQRFACNLNKCRKSNPTYNLLKAMTERIKKDLSYSLITQLYIRERELLIEIIRRFDRIYRDHKRTAGLLDFSDLEEFAVRLLEEHPETRARVQRQFDHILMDEFQDTNGQQARLIGLLRPPDRFYAVGDINQSIYGFRHAEPGGFREYRDEIERRSRHLVELTENFRSRADILDAVEYLTDGLSGIVPRPLVPGRQFDDAPDCSVEVIAASEPPIEAAQVARRIVELSSSCAFRDFAVLVRNTEVIPDFSKAFEDAGIPYVVNRGRGFYESREVKDLTHLLRIIANPRDQVSLAVVLRSPLVGASDDDLLRLKAEANNLAVGLAHCAPGTPLAQFRDRLDRWRARREYVTFDLLLLEAIDDSGYPAAPNIDKFLAQVRDAASRMSLDEFVEELALVRADNPREADAPPEDSADAVRIMTVHAAKGLEFPVVFVAAIHKGVDSSAPVIGFSRHAGLGARWRNPAAGEDKNDLYLNALAQEIKQRETEEGNRLLYVAMTRAERHLVLSFSATNRKPKEWDKIVIEKLLLDPATSAEFELRPEGDWKVRVRVVNAAPELLRARPIEETREEIETIARPAVEEQYDTNATVTALAKFANCPRQYYLGSYLGYEGRRRRVEEDDHTEDDLPADEFGSRVHDLLAGKAIPKPDPDAARLAEVFRQSPLGRRAGRATRIEREFDFLMAIEGLVVRGQIDLWFEEAGDLIVVDYKTDDVTAAQSEERARDYAIQLRLYAMAVERIAGRAPSRAILHFLRPNRAIEVDLTPSLIESPEQVVRDFQQAQSTLYFSLAEGEHCRRCQFFGGLCPAVLPTSSAAQRAVPLETLPRTSG